MLKIKAIQKEFKSQDMQLLLAENYDKKGEPQKALAEYEQLVPKYFGQEVRCRYALLLVKLGEKEKAKQLFTEIINHVRLSPKFYQRAQSPWVKIAKDNLKDFV